MTTKGNQAVNCNNHPFFGRVGNRRFSLAHNGVLNNDELLRKTMLLPNTSIETDSYIAVQLLEHYGEISFESIKKMAETVSGSFCFSILTDNKELYLVKGSNPLVIFDCGGYYIYASTGEILNKALKRLHIKKRKSIDIKSGEIVKISADGKIDRESFDFSEYDSYFNSRYYWGDFKDENYEALEMAILYAGYFGIDERDILMLSDLGYGAAEIEELLYDPDELKATVNEYREYLCCEYNG